MKLLGRKKKKPSRAATMAVSYADEGTFGKLVRVTRHPLRALAMALAALALSWGVLVTAGVTSAVIGAVAGVVAGEVLGRSKLKLPAIASALGVLLLLSWGAAGLSTSGEAIPSAIGPGAALKLAGALRYGALAFVLVSLVRSIAVRKPAALALELGLVVTAFAVMFAAHRDGVIARPLWLSDWAWQKGIDPGDVFLFLGGAAAVILAVLLVLETRSGRTVSTLIALPALALLAIACLDVVGRPSPEAEDGLGLTDDETGEPPNLDDQGGGPQPGGRDAGGGGASALDGGGGGGRGDGGAGGGEGADGGSQASGADGGGGGSAQRDGGGGNGAGRDAGADGGGAGAGGDGGASGGGADAGARDGGGGGGGAPDAGQQQQQQQQQGQGGQQQQQQQQQPSEAQFTDQSDQSPDHSPAPMAVVVLDNDYSPPAQGYYFRQEVWSQFNGTRLVAATMPGVDDDMLAEFPTRETDVHAPPTADRERVSATVALLVDHQHPFALESPISFEPTRNPNPERFQRAYRFESLAQLTDYRQLLGRHAGNPEWSEEVRAHYLEGHPDPRFAELAQQILDERLAPSMQDDPFARALAIKLWLDHELIYSTAERHANVPDPTIDFLFGNRTGYCVHFAHTAVLLWRAAGIPARIGTGYMVPEENRRGGSSILIRSGDAHAWPELYLEGTGWIVLDISAERNLDQAGQPLDEDLQRMLGEMARDQPADPEDEIRDEPEDGSGIHVDPWIAVLVLASLILAVLYGIKLWRRVVPLFAGSHALPRLRYRSLLDRLAEVGLSREFGETREQFASRVGPLAPAFAEVTALHVAARLRDPRTAAEKRPEWSPSTWRQLSRDVNRQIRGGTKWWRRLLGLLHPVSFLDSR